MKRRTFIAALGSAAAWPLVARADQPSGMPVIGFLNSGSFETYGPQLVSAFMKGLEDVDYVDAGFSKAQIRLTCRSCKHPSLNSRSTSRPRKRSASASRPLYSPAPTR